MFKLSSLGSQVLNDVSIRTAQEYGVELEVLSSLKNNSKGTIVKANLSSKSNVISGIATEKNLIKVSVSGIKNIARFKKEILNELNEKKLIKEPNLKSTINLSPEAYDFLIDTNSLQEVLNFIEKSPINNEEKLEVSYFKNKSCLNCNKI